MSKISRNAPCPCGSGKKYKKCHSSSPSPLNNLAQSSPIALARIPIDVRSTNVPAINISGLFHYKIVRPFSNDPSSPLNAGGVEGLPGLYKVVFALNRPGFSLLPEYSTHLGGEIHGDSHLSLPFSSAQGTGSVFEGTLTAENGMSRLTFRIISNGRGFIGKIQIDAIQANNSREAELKAFNVLAPELSYLSAYFDVPMYVFQIDIIELKTGTMTAGAVAPFLEVCIPEIPLHSVTADYKKYASFYREAVNCNSDNYQFLCFYKIIEGLKKRREKMIRETKERGETIPPQPKEHIPTSRQKCQKWFDSLFPVKRILNDMELGSVFITESIGRNINDIIDKDLRPIRDKIAHGILDFGEEETVSIDNLTDRKNVNRWLPLTKCIARHLLKNEFPEVFQRH